MTRRPVELSEDQLAPCPVRTIVARMLRNLKAIYLGTHDFPSAPGHPAQACRGRRRRSRRAARPRHDLPPARPHRRGHRPAPVLPRLQPDADDAETVADLLAAARRSDRPVELNRPSRGSSPRILVPSRFSEVRLPGTAETLGSEETALADRERPGSTALDPHPRRVGLEGDQDDRREVPPFRSLRPAVLTRRRANNRCAS